MAKQDKAVVNGVSRSAWIRCQLIKNPNITLEQIQTAYAKTKYPQDQPITSNNVSSGKSQIMSRYKFRPWEDFPITARTKRPNASGFIRLYLATFEDPNSITESKALEFLAADGIKIHGGVFRNVRSKLKKNGTAPATVEDEAPLQSNTEPRAGKPDKRKYKRRKKTGEEHPVLTTYEGMEKGIEKLIAEAHALKNWSLVDDLKRARRRTSVAIVHFAD